MKGLLRKVTDYGGSYAGSKSEKRNIILSNYVSIVGCAAIWFLVAALIAFYGFDFGVVIRLLVTSLAFFLPIVLNRFGFVVISRVLLSMLIPAVVFGVSILDLKAGELMSSSSFVGLRLFLLVALCFPFLLFDLKQKGFLILCLCFPILSLVFFDPIFALFDVGYFQNPDYDRFYEFSNVRAWVSAFAIGTILFLLKAMVETAERLNQTLLLRLEDQNRFIKRQAEADVFKLNEELNANLDRLSEREFILNQSQRVAKVGSWDYSTRTSFTFWSDEMYNILGLEKNVNLKSKALFEAIFGEGSKDIINDTFRLLKTGDSFDRTLRIQTPQGTSKWIRIYAFPNFKGSRIGGLRGICHDITYYKNAEEMLRGSEYKYRSLFEQASDFIAVFDFDGKFHDVNLSWCKTFGYTKEETLRMRVEEMIDPDELKTRPISYDALRNGEQFYNDRRMVRRDGTILEVESNARIFQNDKILAIGRDVTALREAQRQIEVSEATFRGAFEHSANGMALVSVDGCWLKVNKVLCEIVGYGPECLLGRPIEEIVLPEDAGGVRDTRQRLLSGRIDVFQNEMRHVHSSGAIVWVSLNVSLVKDNLGSPLYFVAQIEDITEKKEAKERLALNEANINATINNTQVMIWSVDRDFNLMMFNTQFANYIKKHYGVTIRVGSRIFPSPDSERAQELVTKWTALYARALAGEPLVIEDARHGLEFRYSLNPIVEADKVIGVSIFADDITQQKARDRALAEANRKIGELRLMALRSVMSPHFIFNVLNSIQYFIAKNDRINAINYLSAFSRLIRNILTHSVTNQIALSNEIEMLESYVQLEMTRFENKFDFALEVDPSIEVDSVIIPSLLIQPYVENAILHGLYNKEKGGKLAIRIHEEEENVLLFEIEDNGIGRAAAMAMRRRNILPHTSMGINITEERLKLINQGQRTGFEIEDLMEDGEPRGTRVRIRVSYSST